MLINNGVVNPALVRLVRMQGVTVLPSPHPTWLNDLLQQQWVKAKEGVLRAQLGGRLPNEEEMELLGKLSANEMSIDFDEQYSSVLVLGATLKAVIRRMNFMWLEKTNAGYDVFPYYVCLLGSSRKLDPKLEMPEHVPAILEEVGAGFNSQWSDDAEALDWPVNELQMMNRVQHWLGLQPEARVCVIAPDVAKSDGPGNRPANTAETVKEWLKFAAAGRYLIVSSQPFCEGQKMAVERAVREAGKEGYTFDVCGPAAPSLPLSRWLDNLAKQLWEEVQLLPK